MAAAVSAEAPPNPLLNGLVADPAGGPVEPCAPAAPEGGPWELGNRVGSAEARLVAWRALAWQWGHSELRSVAACRRSVITGQKAELVMSARASARWQQLRTCGSAWACPVCARKVWAGRAELLAEALTEWADRDGYAALVTLTTRHHAKQDLATIWEGLGAAWRAVEQSRGVRAERERLGLVGFVRRIEASWGPTFGWHLHIHAVAFFEREPSEEQLEVFGDALHSAWSARLVKHGQQAPLRGPGVDVKLLDLANPAAAVAGYITQRTTPEGMAARELADAMGGKRGKRGNRTSWELLADAMDGDKQARKMWHEWERASKGKRALTWGPIKRLLGLNEPTDDELAADDDELEAALIAALTPAEWTQLCRRKDGPAELLQIAERAYRSQPIGDRVASIWAAMGDVALTLEAWAIRGPLSGSPPARAGCAAAQ